VLVVLTMVESRVAIARSAARRAVGGLFMWFLTASISLGVSASIIDYFVRKALAGSGIHGVLFDIFLALCGVLWLLVSAIVLYNILRVLWMHTLLPLPSVRIRELDEEKLIRLIKDVVSFYRGYRWWIIALGLFSIIVGAVFVALAVKDYISVVIGVGELMFRLIVAIILLVYGSLDLYLEEKSIARRLAKVKQLEDELSKFIM